jgi:hypothetical protein
MDLEFTGAEDAGGEVDGKPVVDTGGCCIQALATIVIMPASNPAIVNLIFMVILLLRKYFFNNITTQYGQDIRVRDVF